MLIWSETTIIVTWRRFKSLTIWLVCSTAYQDWQHKNKVLGYQPFVTGILHTKSQYFGKQSQVLTSSWIHREPTHVTYISSNCGFTAAGGWLVACSGLDLLGGEGWLRWLFLRYRWPQPPPEYVKMLHHWIDGQINICIHRWLSARMQYLHW